MNAKIEFLNTTIKHVVIAASISFGDKYSYNDDEEITYKLKPLYTNDEYLKFLENLDREYDDGYGGQELFGIIYCDNSIWFDRYEYDGSECWQMHRYPNLRDNFTESQVLCYERYKKIKNIENGTKDK